MRGLANLPENRTVASVPLAKSKNRDPKKPTEILRCASVHREVPWPRVRARCKNRIGSLGMPSSIWGNQWKRWVFFFSEHSWLESGAGRNELPAPGHRLQDTGSIALCCPCLSPGGPPTFIQLPPLPMWPQGNNWGAERKDAA